MKKRNAKRMIVLTTFAAITVASCTGFLTGCGSTGSSVGDSTADTPLSVAVVLGVHKYFPDVSLAEGAVYDSICDAALTYGSLCVIAADGSPYVAFYESFEETDVQVTAQKHNRLAEEAAQTYALIADSEAESMTEEVDTLAAISAAADVLSSEENTEKILYIIDSGLSTAGLLNFAEQNLIEEPAESIVEQLEELHAVPDLAGVTVVWSGLGQTCGEQADLTDTYQYNLKAVWTALLEAAGAVSVTFDKTPLSGEEAEGDLPDCSTVTVVADSLELGSDELPDVIKWDDTSSVRFAADQTEFVDVEAAKEALEPAAVYLAAYPDECVYLFGMTATTTNDNSDGVELAEARAEACKALLVELGASSSQIETVGLGELDNPLRVEDISGDGSQIEEQAQKNRAVIIVKADSDIAETLLACAKG